MNTIIAIIAWIGGLFGGTDHHTVKQPVSGIQAQGGSTLGVHIHNPRTVVALEDTHFKPNR
jgi:hypothetical protein